MEPSTDRNVKQERRRYRTIFESEMVGIIFANLSGPIFDANDFFLNMLGYSRQELENGALDWMKVTAPEYKNICLQAGQDLIDQKQVKPFEKEYLHKDGHRVQVVVSLTPFGENLFIAVILDISQRRKAENDLAETRRQLEERVVQRTRELQQSQSFLEAIFENIPNMVFVKDAKDLRFVRFNRAGEELLGVPRSELMGKSDYDFFPRDQADFFVAKDRQVLKEKSVEDIAEEPIKTKSGVRYLHTKKIPIFNEAGIPQYLLGVSEDITEKKEIEKQARALLQAQIAQGEAELRAQQMSFLSDISSLFNESFDLRKTLKTFCLKACAMMADLCILELLDVHGEGVEVTEVHSRDAHDQQVAREWKKRHPFLRDANEGPGQVLRSGRSILHSQVQRESFVRETYGAQAIPDQPIVMQSIIMVPIIMRDEKPMGVVSYIKKEGSTAYTSADLSLAEEMTRRLSVFIENCRLYFKAQEASRAKSAFLANVSHEIRTPLGAMLGFAEILDEDEGLNEQQKKSVQIVLRNGQLLLRIVDEILDISKVESERIRIEHINFCLASLLDDITVLLKGRADEKNIKLEMRYTDLPGLIRTDPTRLRQILINIIGNAIKFTDSGKVEVRVGMTTSAGKSLLEFRVSDTGIGISEQQREGLFQPFAQADSSTTRRFGGTGLGLFLSRNLARLLGGDVILEKSTAGSGSCFIITIAYEEATEASANNTRMQAQTFKDYANIKKILIVDDASDNRDLFKYHLGKLGIAEANIDVAANGLEAMSKVVGENYSLILMDIQMPEMDGFHAVRELRQQNYQGAIVALTAHAMKGDEEKCLAAGFDGYLQKPLAKEALKKVLDDVNARC